MSATTTRATLGMWLLCISIAVPACSSSPNRSHDSLVQDSTAGDKVQTVEQLTVLPGVGLVFGETHVEIGQTLDNLVGAAGLPSVTLDLGPAGITVEYEDLKFAAQLTPDKTITAFHLLEGCLGQTPGGAGIGSTREALEALYGPGRDDPLLGATWYESTGIVVIFTEGLVVRLHVVGTN